MFGFLFITDFPDYGDKIDLWVSQYFILKLILGILGASGTLSIFLLWGLMFYHWGTHNFTSKKYKILWFLSMTVGMVIGAWIYYLIVYEFGKTLKRKEIAI